MNPLLPGGSGTTPAPTRNASGINQGTNEDDSQNDPHPEASLFHGQREQNSGTERDYDSGFVSLSKSAILSRFQNRLFCPTLKSAVLSRIPRRVFKMQEIQN